MHGFWVFTVFFLHSSQNFKGQVNRMKWKHLLYVDVSPGCCLCFSQVAKCSNRRLCWRSCRVPCLHLPRAWIASLHAVCMSFAMSNHITAGNGCNLPARFERPCRKSYESSDPSLPAGRFSSRLNWPPLPSKTGSL